VTVLAAIVTGSRGVAQASVTLNGIPVHQQTEREPLKTLALAIPLTLRPGPNAIVLTAVEPDGTRRQDVRTVIYDRPIGGPGRPDPARARGGRHRSRSLRRHRHPAAPVHGCRRRGHA